MRLLPANPSLLPEPRSLLRDLLELPLGLGVEREDSGLQSKSDLRLRLADAGKDDPLRGEPALQSGAQLAARDDVRAGAERGEDAQDREVRVRLRRVADEMGDGGERRVEPPEALLDRGAAVDIAGRAGARGDRIERHAVAEELSGMAMNPDSRHCRAR